VREKREEETGTTLLLFLQAWGYTVLHHTRRREEEKKRKKKKKSERKWKMSNPTDPRTKEAVEFIERVTGERFADPGDFQASLKSGVLLCK